MKTLALAAYGILTFGIVAVATGGNIWLALILAGLVIRLDMAFDRIDELHHQLDQLANPPPKP